LLIPETAGLMEGHALKGTSESIARLSNLDNLSSLQGEETRMQPKPFRLIIALFTFTVGVFIATVINPFLTPIIPRRALSRPRVQSMGLPCANDKVKQLREEGRADPDDAYLRTKLAEAYQELGCYDEASNAYREALAIDPSDTDTYSDLGNTYDQLGRYEEAIEVLQKGLKLDPEDAYNQSELGFVYNALKRYQESLKALQRNIQLDPEDAFAHAELGDTYFHLKRYQEAATEARKAISLSQTDDDNPALDNAALVLIKLNQYEEAIQTLRQSISLDPNNIHAYFGLGKVYTILGRREDSIASYKQLLTIRPLTPDEYQLRGLAYLHLGYGSAAALEARNYLNRTRWKGHESPYAGLLAYLGYRQAHRDKEADEMLDEAEAHMTSPAWPKNIYRYLRREITESKLLALASDNNELAEAHAFIGMNLSLAGRTSEALSHLVWLDENNDKDSVEFASLIDEWSQLGDSAGAGNQR
jgi:tetratricopeptide (TPR) repeat protein